MDIDIEAVAEPSSTILRWLVLATAYFLIILFGLGVLDLFVATVQLIASGDFADPVALIELIDTVLLLLIIIEVHRTLVAIVRQEPVVRIVISVAIIAVARQIISFRIVEFDTATQALAAAVSFVGLLIALIIAYFFARRVEDREDF